MTTFPSHIQVNKDGPQLNNSVWWHSDGHFMRGGSTQSNNQIPSDTRRARRTKTHRTTFLVINMQPSYNYIVEKATPNVCQAISSWSHSSHFSFGFPIPRSIVSIHRNLLQFKQCYLATQIEFNKQKTQKGGYSKNPSTSWMSNQAPIQHSLSNADSSQNVGSISFDPSKSNKYKVVNVSSLLNENEKVSTLVLLIDNYALQHSKQYPNINLESILARQKKHTISFKKKESRVAHKSLWRYPITSGESAQTSPTSTQLV